MPSRSPRWSRWLTSSTVAALLAALCACGDAGRTEPCVATEDCFNGLDDDCDLATDCDDSDCAAGAVCVPSADGFAVGAAVGADESCPSAFPGDGLLLGQGLDAGTACGGCACATPSLVCYSQISSFPLSACRIGSWASARTLAPDYCSSGPPGPAVSEGVAELRHAGGCAASGTPSPPPLAWADSARFCAAARLGGGCAAGLACAPRAASTCVVAEGDAACPSGYAAVGSEPWYAGAADTRTCVAECACGPTTGWSCGTAQVRIFSAAGCTGSSFVVPMNTCVGLIQSATMELVGTTSPGSCAPDAGALTGAATPTGPHTLCCLP